MSRGVSGELNHMYKHGYVGKPEYMVWINLIRRCHNPDSQAYLSYGARGITVCDEWRNDFISFITDVGPRPSSKHQIERIDNNKGYEPGNCKWATVREQARNRRSNRLLTHNGQTLCAAEWAEIVGLPINAIYTRIRQGWDTERILTTPLRITKR